MTAIARHTEVVPTGLPFGTVRRGAQLCHFYRTAEDLEEIVVPFFASGLANREKCMWIVHAPLTVQRARAALAARVPDLDARTRAGQMVILDRADWLALTGTLASEQRIEYWIASEHAALGEGFTGLRITSDTAWTDATGWRQLVRHDARMHRALHGRRITALCSYELDRCGPHEIIDVLHDHKSALLRRDGRWEHVGSATAALALAQPAASRHHSVEFFDDEFPTGSVARRLVDALVAGHAAIAVATHEHLIEIRAAIERRIDIGEALATGRLRLIDAETVHDQLAAAPDLAAACDAYLGAPVREVVRRFGRARVYGELVDVCCARGRRDTAVAVERWWNRGLPELPIEVHCGYRVASFDEAESMTAFRQVCDEHGHVFARSQIGATDPDRLAAELQQVSTILRNETERRAAVREHLVVLQRITSALGEAVTFDNIGSVVTAELAPAVGAMRSGLVIAGELIALRGITTPEDAGAIAQILDHLPVQWSTRAELGPELGWVAGTLVAVVPLVFAHDRIGTLVLGFDEAPLSVAQRALVDDLARQVAQSVERARMFEQAEKERVRAERANAAKDQFLAMLGHELRNPLSPILSATQLMRLRGPEQFVEERATIERGVTHMIRLVDALLDVSQIVQGDVVLAREPSELADIVDDALDIARSVVDEGIEFEVAVPADLVVDVDRQRMRQVVANLMINAAKHAGGRPVEMHACARGESVELAVRDHGTGIDPVLLPYVFDLFVQGKQGVDRAKGGLGIGLAIARSLVDLHGGTIAVASDSQGSTFTITLPRWQAEHTTDQIAASPGGRRILVVDDNEDAAWLLGEALRMLGHEVRVAHDGRSALATTATWSPEIALLDIGLPGMDGFELCRELGQLASPPHCIAVSGYGQPRDREQAREAGFDAHFVKPVDLRDVQAAIEAFGTDT